MLLFAAFGYIMKKLDYPIMGFILGFILGGMVDRELLKTFLLFEDDLAGLWQRPAFIVLIVMTAFSIFWPKVTTAIKSLRK